MGRFKLEEKGSSSTSLANQNNQPFFGPAKQKAGLGATLLNVPEPKIYKSQFGISATLYFAKDSSFLESANFAALNQLADELKLIASPSVLVNGHASAEGKIDRNQQLSESRRNMVIALLKDPKAIVQPNFTGQGLGCAQPAVAETGATESEKESQRKLNRRVEVFITYPPGTVKKPDEKTEGVVKPKLPGLRGPLRLDDIPEDVRKKWEQEDRIKKMFQPIPPAPKQRSLNDIIWGKVTEGTSKALKGLGIKGKANEFLTDQLVGAFKKGGEKALDAILDQTDLNSQQKEMLKKSIEAASKTEIIP